MMTELENGGDEIKRGRGRPPLHREEVKSVEPVQEEKVKIILEENENIPPTGQFFGLNDKSYILRPGEIAEVPIGIIDILDNAVESRPVVDPSTKQTVDYRPRHRFGYRIVK
jgi:hypothetical protein